MKKEYEKHPEAIANRYTLKCMTIAISLLCLVWLMNILNIFMVDARAIGTAVVMALIVSQQA